MSSEKDQILSNRALAWEWPLKLGNLHLYIGYFENGHFLPTNSTICLYAYLRIATFSQQYRILLTHINYFEDWHLSSQLTIWGINESKLRMTTFTQQTPFELIVHKVIFNCSMRPQAGTIKMPFFCSVEDNKCVSSTDHKDLTNKSLPRQNNYLQRIAIQFIDSLLLLWLHVQ